MGGVLRDGRKAFVIDRKGVYIPFMALKRDKLTKVVDPAPRFTARDVAQRIAPSLDSDEIARTAQRVKHYARDGLIYAEGGGGEGPGR